MTRRLRATMTPTADAPRWPQTAAGTRLFSDNEAMDMDESSGVTWADVVAIEDEMYAEARKDALERLDVDVLAKALVKVVREQAGEPYGEGWPGYVDVAGNKTTYVTLIVSELAAGVAAEYRALIAAAEPVQEDTYDPDKYVDDLADEDANDTINMGRAR